MSDVKLKPCPFCDGVVGIVDSACAYEVRCSTCDLIWPAHGEVDYEKLRKDWNRRADSGWVAVADRLPDDGVDVIVFGIGRIGVGGMGEMETDKLFCDDADLMDPTDITHWRPLPPPPDKESQ